MEKLIELLLDKNTGRVFFENGGDNPTVEELNKQLEEVVAEVERYKKEFADAKTRRTSALARAQTAEKELETLKASLEGLPSSDEYNHMKKEYTDLKNEMERLKEEAEERRLADIKDEKEREKARLQKEFEKQQVDLNKKISELEKKIADGSQTEEKYQKKLDMFRVKALEAEIIEAAHEKAYNPKQVVKLIKNEFTYDDDDDAWLCIVKSKKNDKITDYMTVKERVDAFLDDPDNENLLKADIVSGSHASRARDRRINDGGLLKDQPTDEMYRWSKINDYGVDKNSSSAEKAKLVKTFTGLNEIYGKGKLDKFKKHDKKDE